MDLVLYLKKKESAAGKITIVNWTPTLLIIKKCEGQWAYVSAKQNGRTVASWIQTKELCANAYTYSN